MHQPRLVSYCSSADETSSRSEKQDETLSSCPFSGMGKSSERVLDTHELDVPISLPVRSSIATLTAIIDCQSLSGMAPDKASEVSQRVIELLLKDKILSISYWRFCHSGCSSVGRSVGKSIIIFITF